jgi:DNA-binding MarR family transcriptional regulator
MKSTPRRRPDKLARILHIGLKQTLERVWLRIQTFQTQSTGKLVLRPKQERLLQLLRDQGSMAPAEIWSALDVSKQGAMDLLNPLLEAGLVEKNRRQKDQALHATETVNEARRPPILLAPKGRKSIARVVRRWTSPMND